MAAAFVLAPAAGALAAGMIASAIAAASDPSQGWLGAVVAAVAYGYFGLPPALVVGAPVYALLRGRFALTPIRCALTGALLPGLSWVTIVLTVWLVEGGLGDVSAALRASVGLLALTVPFGALGGWVFWLITAWRPGRPPR